MRFYRLRKMCFKTIFTFPIVLVNEKTKVLRMMGSSISCRNLMHGTREWVTYFTIFTSYQTPVNLSTDQDQSFAKRVAPLWLTHSVHLSPDQEFKTVRLVIFVEHGVIVLEDQLLKFHYCCYFNLSFLLLKSLI